MKKLFLILTYLFLSFNIMNAADLSNKADQPTIQEINEKSKQPDPKKKRMPGISQSIGIYYDNVRQECTFIMPSSISSISITLQSENEVMTGYVSSDYPIWHVDLTPGIYNILCTSDDGRVFEGDIII